MEKKMEEQIELLVGIKIKLKTTVFHININ